MENLLNRNENPTAIYETSIRIYLHMMFSHCQNFDDARLKFL